MYGKKEKIFIKIFCMKYKTKFINSNKKKPNSHIIDWNSPNWIHFYFNFVFWPFVNAWLCFFFCSRIQIYAYVGLTRSRTIPMAMNATSSVADIVSIAHLDTFCDVSRHSASDQVKRNSHESNMSGELSRYATKA